MRTCVSECDICRTTQTVPMPEDLHSMDEAPPQPLGWTRLAVVTSEWVVDPSQDELAEVSRGLSGLEADFMGALIRSKTVPFTTTFDLCPACLATAMGPLHAPLLQRLKDRTDLPSPPEPPIIPFPRSASLEDEASEDEVSEDEASEDEGDPE